METEWLLRAVSVRTPVYIPACSPDGIRSGAGPRTIRFASGPSQVLAVFFSGGRLGTRASTPPDPFDCWRRCPRTDSVYTPVGDALALGTFRTRLETRTKESSMFASHRDSSETY